MRVAIVQDVIALYNAALFERLARHPGVELRVFADVETPHPLNQFAASRSVIPVTHVRSAPFAGLRLRPGLIRAVREFEPDIVVVGAHMRTISELVLMLWCRATGVRVAVWDIFHRLGSCPRHWDLYQTLVGRLAHACFPYGQRGRQEQERRGVPAARLHVISMALNEEPLIALSASLSAEMIDAFRLERGVSGRQVILHVARLTCERRADLLLEAFRCLHERGFDDALLVFIGTGPMQGTLERQAQALGIAHSVRFLGAVYDEAILARWFRAASIFAIGSSMGLSIHHAMCYGLPPITDENVWNHGPEIEMLKPGVNGLVYATGSATNFADKLAGLLNDPLERQRLGRNATATVLTEYTLARKVANFVAALRATSDEVGQKNRLAVNESRL